jgi:hypothetical protein
MSATGSKGVDPMTADLFTGKDEIDREEALYLARKEAVANLYPKIIMRYSGIPR